MLTFTEHLINHTPLDLLLFQLSFLKFLALVEPIWTLFDKKINDVAERNKNRTLKWSGAATDVLSRVPIGNVSDS